MSTLLKESDALTSEFSKIISTKGKSINILNYAKNNVDDAINFFKKLGEEGTKDIINSSSFNKAMKNNGRGLSYTPGQSFGNVEKAVVSIGIFKELLSQSKNAEEKNKVEKFLEDNKELNLKDEKFSPAVNVTKMFRKEIAQKPDEKFTVGIFPKENTTKKTQEEKTNKAKEKPLNRSEEKVAPEDEEKNDPEEKSENKPEEKTTPENKKENRVENKKPGNFFDTQIEALNNSKNQAEEELTKMSEKAKYPKAIETAKEQINKSYKKFNEKLQKAKEGVVMNPEMKARIALTNFRTDVNTAMATARKKQLPGAVGVAAAAGRDVARSIGNTAGKVATAYKGSSLYKNKEEAKRVAATKQKEEDRIKQEQELSRKISKDGKAQTIFNVFNKLNGREEAIAKTKEYFETGLDQEKEALHQKAIRAMRDAEPPKKSKEFKPTEEQKAAAKKAANFKYNPGKDKKETTKKAVNEETKQKKSLIENIKSKLFKNRG